MALPTRAELDAEVDRQFHEAHPEAPEHLDPNDAEQAHLVEEWQQLRDTAVNEWTDRVFFEFHPVAAQQLPGGRLDPNDPNQAPWVEEWLDIRNQIRDGVAGQWDWNGLPGSDHEQSAHGVPASAPPAAPVGVSGDEPAPTGADFAAGRAATDVLVDKARVGARKYAAVFNEWATYDGSEAGARAFAEAMKDLADDDWVGIGVEFVRSFFEDLAAANAAGDITQRKWEFFHPFVEGFVAGLQGATPGPSSNPLFEQVGPQVAASVRAFDAATRRGTIGFLLWENPASISLMHRHPDLDMSDPSSVMPDYLWEARSNENYLRDGLHAVVWNRDN